MRTSFQDRLAAACRAKATAAIVGIDPVLERLPAELQPPVNTLDAAGEAIEAFGRAVIDCVAPSVPAVKINSGFFEAYYEVGVAAYYRLISYAHERGLLVIGDIKRGDIGSTARLYARGHLASPALPDVDEMRIPDAVTLAGYLGENAIKPFVEVACRNGRGVYVLVRPSDPGADRVHEFGAGAKFYQHMAALVSEWGDDPELRGECGLSCVGAVVAPKDPESTAELRLVLANTPFLVPGYGAQGATAEACRPCFRKDGSGAVVNASRSVIYAYEAAGRADGDDDHWRESISEACRRFAADVASITP